MTASINSVYPYGIRSTLIRNNYQNSPISSVEPVHKVNDSTATDRQETLQKKRLNPDSQRFLQQYQRQYQNLQAAAQNLNLQSDRSLWHKSANHPSTESITQAAQRLADAHRETLDLLKSSNNNSLGVRQALDKLATSTASAEALDAIGFSYDEDGGLRLDSRRLAKAYEQDPQQVQALLSDKDGLAQKIQTESAQALNQPSMNLINETKSLQQDYATITPTAANRPAVAVNTSYLGRFLDVRV